MFCPKCRNEIAENVKFCGKCGSTLNNIRQEQQKCREPSAAEMPPQFVKVPRGEKAQAEAAKARKKGSGIKGIAIGAICVLLLAIGLLAGLFLQKQKVQEESVGSQSMTAGKMDQEQGQQNVSGQETLQAATVNLTQEREEQILALSEKEWLLAQAARKLVAERLAATSFVTVDPRECFSITDVMLDGISGNLIVSEGAKAMYQSIAEGRFVSEICRNTLESAAAQVPQYLSGMAEDALQGMVTDLIGVDVFSALDFIDQWKNASDMPVVLLQQIVYEQRRDVYKLTLFLEQDVITAADMYKIAQLMYAIQMREQEIATVRSTSAGGNWTDYRDMRILAGQYAANETKLLYLAQTQVSGESEARYEVGEDAFADDLQGISERLMLYSVLAETELGDVAVNYDVEGFQEAQKTVSQEGALLKTLTGELLGGLMAEGGQQNEDWLQENRAALCDRMTDYVEESYLEVASARAEFMGQYGALQDLMSVSGDSLSLAEQCLGQSSWETQLDEAAKAYLTALAKYRFDLESAYILYDCTLTDSQADFMFELALEQDQVVKALQSCQGVEHGGYSEEEAADRWCALLESYKQLVDQTVDRSLALGGNAPGLHANGYLTIYGETTYQAYGKEYAVHSKPLTIVGGTGAEVRNPRYYYDASGNLLCVVYGINKIIYRGNVPVVFFIGEQKNYPWELETGGWELQRMSEYGGKAQNLYGKFVNGT